MTAAELWVYGSEFLDREQTQKIVHSFLVLPTMLYCQMDRTDELVKEGQIPPTIRLSRLTQDSLDDFFADDDRFNALTNAYLYYNGEVPGCPNLKVLLSPHTKVWRRPGLDFYNVWEQELNAKRLNGWHHVAAVFYAGTSTGTMVGKPESTTRLPDDFLNYSQILVDQLMVPGQESKYLLGLRHGQEFTKVHREGADTRLLTKEDFTNVMLRNRLLRNL